MAVKTTASLSAPESFTTWVEFDLTTPEQFSIHVSNIYKGVLTLQVRTRETNAVVNERRFKSGEKLAVNGEIVSKEDIRIGFIGADYRSGVADIVIQPEGQ